MCFKLNIDGEELEASMRDVQELLFNHKEFMNFIAFRAFQVAELMKEKNNWIYNDGIGIFPPIFEDGMVILKWEDGDDGYKTFSMDLSFLFMDLKDIQYELVERNEDKQKKLKEEAEQSRKDYIDSLSIRIEGIKSELSSAISDLESAKKIDDYYKSLKK